MKVALADEMREIDRKAQQDYGMSGDLLMEKAALVAAEVIKSGIGSLNGKRINIFCGKGNNGGDGLALARILWEEKAEVTITLAYHPEQYAGLAAQNLLRAQRFGVPVTIWSESSHNQLAALDLCVDALLGTGAKGAPHGSIAEIIAALNASHQPVVALDLPSGIDADTGQVFGCAIQARRTVTFGLPQPGLLQYPGAELAGELVIAPIGFPRLLLESSELKINCLDRNEVIAQLPKHHPDAHKGTGGHLLIVGGSPGMTGSVALSALGALRAGCGLVTVALRDPDGWREKPTEAMAISWQTLASPLVRFRCAVVGPGMTTTADGLACLERLLRMEQLPLVIDADGLNLLAQNRVWLNGFVKSTVLTPHPGEMARLTGMTTDSVQKDRLAVASKYAREWNATVVLKGARTVIALPTGTQYINLTGNSAMATAGMGDVLAGVIGSLICQGNSPEDAAVLGAYLHGMAGDLAAKVIGPVGIVASDVIKQLPQVWRRLSDVEGS